MGIMARPFYYQLLRPLRGKVAMDKKHVRSSLSFDEAVSPTGSLSLLTLHNQYTNGLVSGTQLQRILRVEIL